MNEYRYTVHRTKSLSDASRKGSVHASRDGNSTICGKDIDKYWHIHTNDFTGKITCKTCVALSKMKKF